MALKRILLQNTLIRTFSVQSSVFNETKTVDEKFQQISRERTLNMVQIIGRVGHNPRVAGEQLKNTQKEDEKQQAFDEKTKEENSEKAKKISRVVLFSLATNEYQGMDDQGTTKYRTDWHRITLISHRLQNFAVKNLRQGDRVHIIGRLHYDLVKNKSGEPRLVTNIVADDCIILNKFTDE